MVEPDKQEDAASLSDTLLRLPDLNTEAPGTTSATAPHCNLDNDLTIMSNTVIQNGATTPDPNIKTPITIAPHPFNLDMDFDFMSNTGQTGTTTPFDFDRELNLDLDLDSSSDNLHDNSTFRSLDNSDPTNAADFFALLPAFSHGISMPVPSNSSTVLSSQQLSTGAPTQHFLPLPSPALSLVPDPSIPPFIPFHPYSPNSHSTIPPEVQIAYAAILQYASCWGSTWGRCVDEFIDFERSQGFDTKSHPLPSSRQRPVAIFKKWNALGRVSSGPEWDALGNGDGITYGAGMWAWWVDIQPSGRLIEGDFVLARRDIGAIDWKRLRKSGPGGLFLVLVGLTWWKLMIGDDNSDWAKAVVDVTWALHEMKGVTLLKAPRKRKQ